MTTFKGAYRRTSTEIGFLPCGTTRALPVDGDPPALRMLRERWRWISVQFERPVYLVAGGAIVSDTVPASDAGADSASGPRVVERFFVMRVDSVRAWEKGDCGLARAPRW